MRSATPPRLPTAPRQQVEAGFAAYFQLVVEHQSAFRLLFGSDLPDDPELSRPCAGSRTPSPRPSTTLIDAGLDSEHRRLLAYAVVGMATGASRHWLAGNPSRTDPPGVAEADLDEVDDLDDEGTEADRIDQLEAARLAKRVSDLAWAGLRSVHRD